MSCELRTLALIDDLAAVRSSLKLEHVDAWLTTVHFAHAPPSHGSAATASVPTTGHIVFAHASRFTILLGHWDADAQRQRYSIEHTDQLAAAAHHHTDAEEATTITAVACLPIAGGAADWTCIVLGTAGGAVRFFSDAGDALTTQLWQPHEPVQHLKVQTGVGSKHSAAGATAATDELHVLQSSSVCIVPGGPLVQLLRNRHHSRTVGAGGGLRRPSPLQSAAAGGDAPSSNEPLPCRKWTYGGKGTQHINDGLVVGAQPPCMFDHLLAASRDGGFYAQFKAAPPQNALIVSVGSKPYVGFHSAQEGFAQPVLAVVARAVAHHIKSALPTWLTGGSSSGSGAAAAASASSSSDGSNPPAPQPAEPMLLRFGLCDAQRIGLAVWLAPDRRHAAVADNLGRVILIDCVAGVAVRVWKGYRDAQCGFVLAREKRDSRDPAADQRRRHAQFLVIYAPKRACLECWLLQRGPRVAAFTVSRGGRLLSGLAATSMGAGAAATAAASSSSRSRAAAARSAASAAAAVPGCVFVDACGDIREICVPFHCALSDAYARTSKDLHLVRRIKLCVRNSEPPELQQRGSKDDAAAALLVESEVRECCAGLQTDEVRMRCVQMLVRMAKTEPRVLRAALQAILTAVSVDGTTADASRATAMRLQRLAGDYLGLVELYMHLKQDGGGGEGGGDAQTTTDDDDDRNAAPMQIHLSMTELENVEQFITLKVLETGAFKSPHAASRVTFTAATKSTWFTDYLACFECGGDGEDADTANTGPRLRSDCRSAALASVGEQLFGAYVEQGRPVRAAFARTARAARVPSEDLMRLLLAYWLDRPFAYTQSAELIEHCGRFGAIGLAICRLAGPEAITTGEYNAVSAWWQMVRETLLESRRSVQCLLAAMMCRSLAERLARETSAGSRNSISSGGDTDGGGGVDEEAEEVWEQVPQEAAEWSLLVDKLDDVAVLDLALGSSLQAVDEDGGDGIVATMPVIPFGGGELDVSLAAIVRGGKGIVSELVAKWIISLAVGPEMLAESSETNEPQSVTKDGEEKSGDATTATAAASPNAKLFTHYWLFLRGRFPFSLRPCVIQAHMAWEYFCHWSKHMADMQLLRAALRCLAAIPVTTTSTTTVGGQQQQQQQQQQRRLKHGLCCMIWNAHLKIPLQAASKLINKTGRLPTEALCMQDIGLSASLVADLLEHSDRFWTQFSESCASEADAMEVSSALRHEELLQDGPVALAQLAIEQTGAAHSQLRLHHELIQVLYLMAALNLRLQRPVQAVFDASSMLIFFGDMSRTGEDRAADAVLQHRRTEFLALCISATMDSIRCDLDGTVFVTEHESWMERVHRLAAAWRLNGDELRRHQIAELYAHGWDEYAGERMDEAALVDADAAALGVVLLRLAGRRLNAFVRNRPRRYAEVASVGSVVTDYLDTLHNSRDRFERATSALDDVQLDGLIGLAVKAFTCLADTEGREKRVAAQLFDACQRLKEQEEHAASSRK